MLVNSTNMGFCRLTLFGSMPIRGCIGLLDVKPMAPSPGVGRETRPGGERKGAVAHVSGSVSLQDAIGTGWTLAPGAAASITPRLADLGSRTQTYGESGS